SLPVRVRTVTGVVARFAVGVVAIGLLRVVVLRVRRLPRVLPGLGRARRIVVPRRSLMRRERRRSPAVLMGRLRALRVVVEALTVEGGVVLLGRRRERIRTTTEVA